MLILSLARGGLVNTYYGDLGLLDYKKAAFLCTSAVFVRALP